MSEKLNQVTVPRTLGVYYFNKDNGEHTVILWKNVVTIQCAYQPVSNERKISRYLVTFNLVSGHVISLSWVEQKQAADVTNDWIIYNLATEPLPESIANTSTGKL